MDEKNQLGFEEKVMTMCIAEIERADRFITQVNKQPAASQTTIGKGAALLYNILTLIKAQGLEAPDDYMMEALAIMVYQLSVRTFRPKNH